MAITRWALKGTSRGYWSAKKDDLVLDLAEATVYDDFSDAVAEAGRLHDNGLLYGTVKIVTEGWREA